MMDGEKPNQLANGATHPSPVSFDLGYGDDGELPPMPDEWEDYSVNAGPGGSQAASGPGAAAAASGDVDQPIPRITIAAFCERAETLRIVTSAASDRRLAKATLTAELGGVEAALAQLGAQASPNLLIIDSGAVATELLQSLDRLAGVVDGDCKVIVVGAANDITLYRELMRRGVSEYLVSPITPLQLIKTIAALFADPSTPFAGRMISFVAARGGVGSSTIAHNTAWALAERFGATTTLLDLDLAFGTTSLDFNQDAAAHIGDALAKGESLDETLVERMLVKATDRLSLFLAPASLDVATNHELATFEHLLDQVRRVAPFVVLDLPHQWSGWIRKTLYDADDVVIVTSPDLAGLRNAKNCYDLLVRERPNDPAPHVVLNMVGVPKRPEIPLKDFTEALGAAPLATIAFDPALFGSAANNGQMAVETQPQAKASLAIEELARGLCGRQPQARRATDIFSKVIAWTR